MKPLRFLISLLLVLTLSAAACAESLPSAFSLVPAAETTAAEPEDASAPETVDDGVSSELPAEAAASQPDERFTFAQDEDARRGIEWGLTKEEVALAEGVKAGKKNVIVKSDVKLYRNEIAKLTYQFENDRLVARVFQLKNKKDYDTTVYSLFIRYGVPFQMKGKNAVWELTDMQISTRYGSTSTITYTAKELQNK